MTPPQITPPQITAVLADRIESSQNPLEEDLCSMEFRLDPVPDEDWRRTFDRVAPRIKSYFEEHGTLVPEGFDVALTADGTLRLAGVHPGFIPALLGPKALVGQILEATNRDWKNTALSKRVKQKAFDDQIQSFLDGWHRAGGRVEGEYKRP